MPKFSANLTMMFTERPLPDRFATAAAAGFEAVEVQFPYEMPAQAIAEHLAEAGLTLDLINLPPGNLAAGDRGLAVYPERRAEFEASVGTALGYAATTGAKKLHLMAGIADPDDAGARTAFLSAIALAANAAGPDRTILLEPLNGRDVPGYFLNDFDQAAAIIAELALPNVKLQFDFYHRQIIAGDVMSAFVRFQPIIGHVQFASVPDRGEPDRGELAYTRIFDMLDDLGHEGFVGAEYAPRGRTEDGLGWFQPFRNRN
ncbi:Hydroxypyruvate isomerase [hydrothermal vent metagenome]|uniref:Hydroxypyruvate isomerase n=1 Tax=hydrothermal vent metagenome TaxID=652676 RepID=A0A3B0TJB3_9ZZZZ